MLEKNLTYLSNLYANLPSYNEETVKICVVIDFLNFLGYDKRCFHCEARQNAGLEILDIVILDKRTNFTKKMLIVECKKGDNGLIDSEININSYVQLINYLNNGNIEWGILTNGNCYILLNNTINGTPTQKEVLRFYLNKSMDANVTCSNIKNANNLKYFRPEHLFEDRTTKYFKYLAEFKISFKNEKSINQYESTIYNFFNYLSEQEGCFNLSYINPDKFKKFLINDINLKTGNNSKKIPYSEATLINKFAHVSSLCDLLENRGYITSNPFRNLEKEFILNGFSIHDNIDKGDLLKESEVNLMLESYNNTREPLRNKLIFLLILYLGLDIQEIEYLKIKDINLTKETITIGKRELPLHPKICNMLKYYLSERKKNNIKCEYLFCSFNENEYRHFVDGNFDRIINKKFDSLDIPNSRKKLLNSSFVKSSVIKKMYFECNYHLEEIVKFSALSLTAMNTYITIDDINKKANINKILKKHPYQNVFDNLDN